MTHTPFLRTLGAVLFPLTLLLSCVSLAQAEVPESYRAAWNAVRPKLDENIERYRKGDAAITVVDATGKPIADASLTIQQKTHAFLFGCNILVLGQLGDKNEKFEQAFVKLFNLATTTFCWNVYETEPGKMRFAEGSEEIWRRPPPDRVVAFGKKHGLTLKGQPLMCAPWHPTWAPKDPEQAKKAYQKWFATVAERYGRDFQIWDVVNESERKEFCLQTPDRAYVGWAFQQAKACFPADALLEINEGTSVNAGGRDKYFQQVKGLLDQGAGVRSIGFQFHLFSAANLKSHLGGKSFPPAKLIETYEKYGELGLPLFITEITIPTTLEEGEKGEAIQAEVAANFYRLWFSVPKMQGIIYWNLPDGAAWKTEGKAKAGLLNEELDPKPAYHVLDKLINHEWKTNLTAKTDAQGKAGFRGFHGKYLVTVTAGGRSESFEIDLTKQSAGPHTLTLKP